METKKLIVIGAGSRGRTYTDIAAKIDRGFKVVGVAELVTFPFGWSPIIEPEYVLQKTKTSYWTVRRPSFHKRY